MLFQDHKIQKSKFTNGYNYSNSYLTGDYINFQILFIIYFAGKK